VMCYHDQVTSILGPHTDSLLDTYVYT